MHARRQRLLSRLHTDGTDLGLTATSGWRHLRPAQARQQGAGETWGDARGIVVARGSMMTSMRSSRRGEKALLERALLEHALAYLAPAL